MISRREQPYLIINNEFGRIVGVDLITFDYSGNPLELCYHVEFSDYTEQWVPVNGGFKIGTLEDTLLIKTVRIKEIEQ